MNKVYTTKKNISNTPFNCTPYPRFDNSFVITGKISEHVKAAQPIRASFKKASVAFITSI